MTTWAPGVASVPFDVVIDNISDAGVTVIHDQPLPIGLRHVLSVPEGDGKRSVMREFQVAKCDLGPDGRYKIELVTHIHVPSAKDRAQAPARRSHLKLLALATACVGLIIALFAPI